MQVGSALTIPGVARRRLPSFAGLKPASALTSQVKRSNRSVDTRHERLLRSVLWRQGFRFRKNDGFALGRPDIVFRHERVAVFCDGDFWHGRAWRGRFRRLQTGTNATYWLEKIRSNIRRDRRINRALAREGWLVLRLWETDILQNPVACAKRIGSILRGRQGNKG
jgi:DNA mismatch endonuclease (patch repair protein)